MFYYPERALARAVGIPSVQSCRKLVERNRALAPDTQSLDNLLGAFDKRFDNSFVSGHDFSRAVTALLR